MKKLFLFIALLLTLNSSQLFSHADPSDPDNGLLYLLEQKQKKSHKQKRPKLSEVITQNDVVDPDDEEAMQAILVALAAEEAEQQVQAENESK